MRHMTGLIIKNFREGHVWLTFFVTIPVMAILGWFLFNADDFMTMTIPLFIIVGFNTDGLGYGSTLISGVKA
ncbi:MAG: hypothetical protein FWF79_00920 [Defluviitaleaceae bacterium]|nr:hypothetical protein [Defluviitaleaceae bacterium]